jgi:FkbM family methyltransferase
MQEPQNKGAQLIKYLDTEIIITEQSAKYHGSFTSGAVYESDVVERFLNDIPENGTVLDIGACTGSYAMLDLLKPGIKIHSFEPSRVYHELVKNISLNGSKTVCYNYAVSDKEGTFDFNEILEDLPIALSMLGGNPASHKNYKTFEIKTVTIDSLNLNPDIIKIDTEGHELMVLKGGENTIKMLHPIIYCEYSQENTSQYGYNANDSLDLLKNWGYEIELINGNIIAKYPVVN